MNTEVFNPTALSMTAAARRHVSRQLARENAAVLQLAVTKSGCNGYMYELRFVPEAPPDGRQFSFDDVTVHVDNADWPLVVGTEIDYVTEGLNAILRFRNPNAASECGCGESFSVATPPQAEPVD